MMNNFKLKINEIQKILDELLARPPCPYILHCTEEFQDLIARVDKLEKIRQDEEMLKKHEERLQVLEENLKNGGTVGIVEGGQTGDNSGGVSP